MRHRVSRAAKAVVLAIALAACSPMETMQEMKNSPASQLLSSSSSCSTNPTTEMSSSQREMLKTSLRHPKARGRGRRAGHVIYSVKSHLTEAQNQALQAVISNSSMELRSNLSGHARVQLARFHKRSAEHYEEDVALSLLNTGAVDFAEPDYVVAPDVIVNDPQVGSQYHHGILKTIEALDLLPSMDPVLVGSCDTGFHTDHPDLKDQLALPGWNVVDGSSDVSPIHGHGTITAGALGASIGNGIGIAGVAPVKIIPVRISNSADGTSFVSYISRCINHLADRGVKVVSISQSEAGGSSSVDNATKYLESKGGVAFVSSSNKGQELAYPDFTSFMLIGSINSNDEKSWFSNYGGALDFVAPGEGIVTLVGMGYGGQSGTSLSTPLAAGVAALVYAAYPAIRPEQVKTILKQTAIDIGSPGRDIYFGYGRVNAQAAVQAALALKLSEGGGGSMPPPPPIIVEPPLTISVSSPLNGSFVSGLLAVTTNPSAASMSSVELWMNGSLHSTQTSSPFSFSIDTTQLSNGSMKLKAVVRSGTSSATSAEVTVTVQNISVVPSPVPQPDPPVQEPLPPILDEEAICPG